MKLTTILILLCALPLILTGCAAPKDRTARILEKNIGKDVVQESVTIKPYKSYEECIEILPGMVFDYDFEASEFLNFNVHYHGEDKVHYPVLEKGIITGKGTVDPAEHDFYTPDQEYYCLMWDNSSLEPVDVVFKCIVRNRGVSNSQ